MALLLGVDTGGTYTDAVLIRDETTVIASAKALTTRADLAIGVGQAVRRVLAAADVQRVRWRWRRCRPRWQPMRWSKGRAGASR
jgi:N-methylhydantoinase A/oxoprolinase/acetone carboxylase beta subunit